MVQSKIQAFHICLIGSHFSVQKLVAAILGTNTGLRLHGFLNGELWLNRKCDAVNPAVLRRYMTHNLHSLLCSRF